MNDVKILWVDDEIDFLKPHILFLQGKGYDVETCNNGYDAIDLAASKQYDLIILDEMMPGLTGLETLPRIKEIRPMTPSLWSPKARRRTSWTRRSALKLPTT